MCRSSPRVCAQCGDNRGWGLRARSGIKPGELIMEYVGEVINDVQHDDRVREYARIKEKHM